MQTRSPSLCLLNEWSVLWGNTVLSCQDKCSLVNGSSRTLLAGLILGFFVGLGFFLLVQVHVKTCEHGTYYPFSIFNVIVL